MTGSTRLVVSGVAVAAVGCIVWAWQAAARTQARSVADFTEAYGGPAGSVSSLGVYTGVSVLVVGVVLALSGIIIAAARQR